MSPCVFPATAADLPAMVALLGELFAQEHDFRPDPERQRRGLEMLLERPEAGQLFVLRQGEAVLGMVNLLLTISTAEGAPVGILEDLIIAAPYRGRGLARQLVSGVLDWARARGLARLTLLTDHDNLRAQSFYAGFGFKPSAMRVMRLGL
ncbi:GNAT family N-acetyltransferase [Azovibrio restrictus]|uniref:GNAT family N-acetyltransferase n=1 Tax=Azovibrio restrictus TaxID=146938 RepID=UPI0026F0AE45|nr:GNAT family N-acetyltransferase [Azovibrio restrictus]